MSEKSTKEYDATKTPFSWDKLDGLLAYKSSLNVCASILEVHDNTIKNHIKDRYGKTFTQYADMRLSPTKVRLVQKAIKMAEAGDRTMLIFCLKNINGWQDKLEQSVNQTTEIIVRDSDNEL